MSKHWPVMLICGLAKDAECDARWSKQLRPNKVVESSNELWPSFPPLALPCLYHKSLGRFELMTQQQIGGAADLKNYLLLLAYTL